MKTNREIELMICLKEQGYSVTLDGKTISFSIDKMIKIWDILSEENKDG